MRSLIAIAALVVSLFTSAETPSGLTYLAVDLRSMDYFWLKFSEGSGIRNKIVSVTFNAKSAYMARRRVGDEKFFEMEGYVTPTALTITRDGELFMSGTPSKGGWEGYFYDENGNQDGRFIATTDFDYSKSSFLWYICGDAETYRCTKVGRGVRKHLECKGRGFPGKFSHLTFESCHDELFGWVDKQQEKTCSNRSAAAASLLDKFVSSCDLVEPNSTFKITRPERLYTTAEVATRNCMFTWVKKSRLEKVYIHFTSAIEDGRKAFFRLPEDPTKYNFGTISWEGNLEVYFDEDFPSDLEFLVNEAAYSCALDSLSRPPEGFWTAKWWAQPPEPPKPTHEVLIPTPEDS